MFAPLVFIALIVFIKKTLPGPIVLGVQRCCGQDHFRFTSLLDRDFIKFGECVSRELGTLYGLHTVSTEDDILSVRSELAWYFVGRVGSQPPGTTSLDAGQEHIIVTVSVGSESDQFTVRGPNRRGVMSSSGGERLGDAAGGGNDEKMPFIAEGDAFPIWRNGRVPEPKRCGLGSKGFGRKAVEQEASGQPCDHKKTADFVDISRTEQPSFGGSRHQLNYTSEMREVANKLLDAEELFQGLDRGGAPNRAPRMAIIGNR